MVNLRGNNALALSILLYLSFSVTVIEADQSIEVYVYDFPDFQSLKKISDYFSGLPELKTTIYYLNKSYCLNEFLEIVNLLVMGGVGVLPPDFCTPCALAHGLNWREIYLTYAFPLLLFFRDGRLTAIVISKYDEGILDQAWRFQGDAAKVFLRDGSVSLLNEKTRVQIEQLFKDRAKPRINPFQVLPLVVAAAAADAVNPCEFFVLVVFLSLVAFKLGRKAVLRFGLAYSVAIFIIYLLMGLGIWRLLGYLNEARIFIVILGFSLGLRSILNFIFGLFGISIGLRESISGFLNRKFKRVPAAFSERLAERLRKFSDNPLSAFIIGVVASAFLLPCTSGPYLIALSLIASLETQTYGLLLLLVYNSIIITPFLIITAGIHLLKLKTIELKKWSSARQRWLNLAGGLLMIGLSVYLIFYAL